MSFLEFLGGRAGLLQLGEDATQGAVTPADMAARIRHFARKNPLC
jgi:hypothetical protein